jgi:alkaline phosphatase D
VATLVLAVALLNPATGSSAPAEFPQGVASRAVARKAILWTRAPEGGRYRYQVATDKSFDDVVASGNVTADPARDFVLKATASGLKPAHKYFFRFRGEGATSDTGRFKTLPSPSKASAMKLAFSGDSDVLWPTDVEPFAVLQRIKEEKPDLFVYMGDTIYSDSETGAEPALTREEKWAKYRANRDVSAAQRLLASVSTWAMWDDHETINDYDGAVLSQSDPALFQAGIEAFSDYWPVPDFWPLGGAPTYYKVDFGKKIDLIFLDERTFRSQSADETDSPCRDAEGDLDLAPTMPPEVRAQLGLGPASQECIDHINDPGRTMLGAEQKQWLKDRLQRSNARWKLIMNEVPLVQLYALPYDRWEGYAAERREILEFIGDNDIAGVVWLTTDIHAHFASPTFVDIAAEGAEPMGWEFVTGPIQTCSLDCEIENIIGPGAGAALQSLLVNNGLIYTDDDGVPLCAEIDEFGYATVSTDKAAARLRVAWKSAANAKNGGRPIGDCPRLSINP